MKDTAKKETKLISDESRNDTWWLIARLAIYPLAVLLPYLLLRTSTKDVCDILNSDATQMITSSSQCVTTYGPHIVWYILGWILCLSVFGWALANFLRQPVAKRLKRLAIVKRQLFYSIPIVIATITAYLFMRRYSSGSESFSYSIDPAGQITESFKPIFGAGISPSTVVLITLVYLGLPLIKYYLTFLSRKRIEGIKKKELFR